MNFLSCHLNIVLICKKLINHITTFHLNNALTTMLPNKVCYSQIKGKESENSYQELKRSQKGQAHTNTRKLNRDSLTGTAIFLN